MSLRFSILTVFVTSSFGVFVLPQIGQGQDKPTEFGIFASQREYFDFMGSFKSIAAENPELQPMIPLVNDIVLQRPIGWSQQKYGGVASRMGLLADKQIRQELELVDEQYERLQTANRQVESRMAQRLQKLDFKNMDPQAIRDAIEKVQVTANSELDQVLLPHQLKRLRQLLLQRQLQFRRLVELLINAPLKEQLQIDDRQSEDLLEADREIQQELEKKIAELRREAHDKLIRKLKPDQQKKFRDLMGELLEITKPGNTSKKPRAGRNKSKAKD